MNEKQIKYLEFIQNIISRMANNSFTIKTWSVTLISALLFFSDKEQNYNYLFLSFIPFFLFLGMDFYFVKQEKLFRNLYDEIRVVDYNTNPNRINLSLETDKKSVSFFDVLKSLPFLLFHISLILLVILVPFILDKSNDSSNTQNKNDFSQIQNIKNSSKEINKSKKVLEDTTNKQEKNKK